MCTRGLPHPTSKHTTTMWAHATTVWDNTPNKLYTYKNYWKSTFIAPCLSGIPPPHEHTQPLCGHTEPLCWSIHLKKLLEKIVIAPCFPGVPPPLNTHNHCVGTCNHCVGQYTSKHYWKTTFIAPCLSGVSPHPPSTHTTTVCAHGTTVWVNTPTKPTGKQPS